MNTMTKGANISAPASVVRRREESHLLPVFARADVAFERGEGAWLYSEDGEKYLDFGSGIAVNVLGHAHPHLVKALKEQAEKVWHVSNLYQNRDGERLASRLCALTFADRVFFTNSGAEALECAIKMARKYHSANGDPNRYRVVTFEGAFHGRTLATIAAGGQKKYLDGFGPKVDGFDQVPFGDIAAMKAACGSDTGAILLETVQGEGGIRVFSAEALREIRAFCDANGLLLILDEVQCGIGRTGKLFAYEWAGIEPDIMAIAKGIGGGFPVGACLSTEKAGKGMVAGVHGTTFGGNMLAMAVGNAVLDVVATPEFLDQVRANARDLTQCLAELKDRYPDVIEDIRGAGLLMGIRTKVTNTDLVTAARAEGLLTVPAGDNVVRLLPPLNIGETEIREARARLDRACAALSAKAAKTA